MIESQRSRLPRLGVALALLVVAASVSLGESPSLAARVSVTIVGPERFLDTRTEGQTIDDRFEGVGRLPAQSVVEIDVTGRGSVPAGALSSVVLNVTAINPAGPGYVTVYPCGPLPNSSTINFSLGGGATANEVLAQLSPTGTLCFFSSVGVHLAADVVGYGGENNSLQSVPPARLLDTRPTGQTVDGASESGGRVPAGGIIALPVVGRGGVPEQDVALVVVNVTAVNPSASGYVTVFPCDDLPNTSSLNYGGGSVVSNEVFAQIDLTDGTICLYSSAATDLVVDVSGHLDTAAVGMIPIAPQRYLDTRPTGTTFDSDDLGAGKALAGSIIEVDMLGRGAVASDAVAVIMNLTAIAPDQGGYATVFPCGTIPNVSALNFASTGGPIANEVLAPLSPTGTVCIFVSATTHVAADVVAYVRF